MQRFAHALVNFFLAKCVVFEGHGRLTAVNFGCERIVQAKLPREYISHDMYAFKWIFPLGEPVQYILDRISCCVGLKGRDGRELTDVAHAKPNSSFGIWRCLCIHHTASYKGDGT
jgi:hypothetical protein